MIADSCGDERNAARGGSGGSGPYDRVAVAHVLREPQARCARLLGSPREEALRAALTRLQMFDLGRFEGQSFTDCRSCDPCLDLAVLLGDIALAGAALSDRLAMRHFSHVSDVSHYTLAS